MPYVPEKFRNRWGFATACALAGALFTVLYFLTLSLLFDGEPLPLRSLSLMPVISLGAFPAGLLAWPSQSPRSRGRMALAGVLTVFLAFVAMTIVAVGAAIFSSVVGGDTEPLSQALPIAFVSALLVLFFGTIFTLGLPYLVGALVAMLFADP